jgi:transposase-like protein
MENEANAGYRRPLKLPSPQERLDLILLGLAKGQPVDRLCRQAGVSRELFYRWMKRVRTSALEALETRKPGPKRVKHMEQAASKLQRMEERLKRLEREAASLRKERNYLEQVNQVSRRIIRRQAGLPDKLPALQSSAPVKKNVMRLDRTAGPIANSGKPSVPWEQRSNPSVPPGASTGSPTGDGSGVRSRLNPSNDEGGSKTP